MISYLASMLLALLCCVGIMTAPARAQDASFNDDQRRAIGEITREYLMRNPEVLQDVMAELERRRNEAQAKSQVEVLRAERDKIFNSPDDYVVGNPQGDVTLVEFLDYNCPYCRKAASEVKALVKADPKLRVVLKEFPVLGPQSLEASRVALAAKPQLKGGRLLEFHMKLMDLRGQVNGERAKAVAKEMGLDMVRLEKDVESADGRTILENNAALADKLGITGTPAFLIGEQLIPGAVGLEPLRQAVANMRTCGKAVC